jgi:hypothetical protein
VLGRERVDELGEPAALRLPGGRDHREQPGKLLDVAASLREQDAERQREARRLAAAHAAIRGPVWARRLTDAVAGGLKNSLDGFGFEFRLLGDSRDDPGLGHE